MLNRFFILLFAAALMAPAAQAADKPMRNDYRVTWKVKGSFKDVRDAVAQAIKGQGLVINNVSHIGNMLSRTGKDLGFKKVVYLDAEALEFCSATVSRKMMEADPHNIVYCPYIIAVYVIPNEPKSVYVSYRRPDIIGDAKSKEALKGVEVLVEKIINEALAWFD